ncbi:MAG: hypothetical protein EXR72_26950 [Myxococcales bacterium]|nr:hypothetical protein [Myxococcales bacterium]
MDGARTTPPWLPVARLSRGHQQALVAADTFFGGFCALSAAVAIHSWLGGTTSWRTPAVLLLFLIANLSISRLSMRSPRPLAIEVVRALCGTVIAPAAYVLSDGNLALWWPGFVILMMDGGLLFGLLKRRPFWGRVLVGWYALLFLASTWWWIDRPDWYVTLRVAGVMAMVGLMWAQIMSILGHTLRSEHKRTRELGEARDALFAEMEVAQQIQTLLLPRDPTLPGNLVSGRTVPASEVGGDYYDVIDLDGKRAFLAIGDACGHGVTSGLTMMMARASLLGVLEANKTAPLPEIYRFLNRSLHRNLARMDIQMFMTFALVEVLGEGRFAAVGRHLPLMIYRRATDTVEEIELDGAWLGMVEDLAQHLLPRTDFTLAPGDLLVLYTDGIVEHAAGGEMFGYDRLKGLIRQRAAAGAGGLIEHVLAEIHRFSSVREDDMTMLVLDHVGDAAEPAQAAPPAPAPAQRRHVG